MEGPIISAAWLAEYRNHPRLVVLDASMGNTFSSNEGGKVVIPGAQHFDLKGAFSVAGAKYPNSFPSAAQFQAGARGLGIGSESIIVCYDDRGIFSSARARWMFRVFGHERVFVLNGGLPGWIAAGYDVEDSYTVAGKEGDFVAELRADRMVDLSYIAAEGREQQCTLVDARSAGRFDGSAEEPRAGLRSGSIPGSFNVPFANLLEDGHFKDKREVESVLQQCTERENDLVFSCGSGVTACVLGLAYEWVTGKEDYRVYDGSWTEYASEFPDVD